MIAGLNGIIQGGVSVKDFSKVTQIDESDSEDILNNFINNDIGNLKDNFYYFEDGDKLKIAINLLQNGFPLDEISVVFRLEGF